ncbi:hypothetical protein ACIQU8_12410 [Streptomyces griseus]|uniref:hypothetical protein n=1 Tax=Streptomyces griseus TaxID=1911 RepID=UPI003815C064
MLISAFFLCSLQLQHVLDFSPPRTGLMFLPVAFATTVGAHLGSVLMERLGLTLLPKGRPDPSGVRCSPTDRLFGLLAAFAEHRGIRFPSDELPRYQPVFTAL